MTRKKVVFQGFAWAAGSLPTVPNEPSTRKPAPSPQPVFDRPRPIETKQVVGILSQGNQYGAYVMGISTAKTLLPASDKGELERIFILDPLIQWIQAQKKRHYAEVARAAAARAATRADEDRGEAAGNQKTAVQSVVP